MKERVKAARFSWLFYFHGVKCSFYLPRK